MKKRMVALALVLILMVLGLSVRTYYISNVKGSSLEEKAENQRFASMKIENERGTFYDRNFAPITGRQVVEKSFKLRTRQPYRVRQRYGDENLAQHLLGYLDVDETRGVSGLEKHYDQELSGEGGMFVNYVKDVNANVIPGQAVNYYKKSEGFYNIQLTLDLRFQKIVEKILDDEVKKNKRFKGAVVMQECVTGEVLAMSSRPSFKRDKIVTELKNESGPFLNRATSAYCLGSIFKIIDVIARVEEKKRVVPKVCSGFSLVEGRRIACGKQDGHGKIGEKEAFAGSCNSYFVENANEIEAKNMIFYAKKLGLGMKTGLFTEGVNEMKGDVPLESQLFNQGDVANLSLGQGYVTATPLQVCNLVNSIANGGEITTPRIFRNFLYPFNLKVKNKEAVKVFSRQNLSISKEAVGVLRTYMEECVKSGTGKKATPNAFGAAGKTGSAEAGGGVVHAWFAGYFPIENPKYSLCVFVENGKSGGGVAAPIFKKIADEVNEIEEYDYIKINVR